jgi:hypothetical protein
VKIFKKFWEGALDKKGWGGCGKKYAAGIFRNGEWGNWKSRQLEIGAYLDAVFPTPVVTR